MCLGPLLCVYIENMRIHLNFIFLRFVYVVNLLVITSNDIYEKPSSVNKLWWSSTTNSYNNIGLMPVVLFLILVYMYSNVRIITIHGLWYIYDIVVIVVCSMHIWSEKNPYLFCIIVLRLSVCCIEVHRSYGLYTRRHVFNLNLQLVMTVCAARE